MDINYKILLLHTTIAAVTINEPIVTAAIVCIYIFLSFSTAFSNDSSGLIML